MGFTVDISGFARLDRKLGALADELEKELDTLLQEAGKKVQTTAKLKIQKGGRTGHVYTRGSVSHQASAPGEAPKADRGTLHTSIFFRYASEVGKKIAKVGTNLLYGEWLELGTSKMAARPWLTPSLAGEKEWIRRRWKAARRRAIHKVKAMR